VSKSDAAAAALVAGDDGTKSKMSPFVVIPLNTTADTQTRAARKCAENYSWLDSAGLCGVVGTLQNWFGWGDDSSPYDSLLSTDNASINKGHLCVMPCSDWSGDYGVCMCGLDSSSTLRTNTQCDCPSLGRSSGPENSHVANSDSPNNALAVNDDPVDGDSTTFDEDDPVDGDSTTFDEDDVPTSFDDSDDDSTMDLDSPETSLPAAIPGMPNADDNGDDTYMFITDENTGTECLLHCPHLTHFHWPGETRRVLNCREYVKLMSPDLCDVVDSS
jgi:hypothetical protein